MRAIATAASALALALAGCSAGTTNGFDFQVPAGWEDRTDQAETKTGRELEYVLEGPESNGVPASITISRTEIGVGTTLAAAVDKQRREARAANPREPTKAALGGEEALEFDFAADGKRGRTVSAKHGETLYTVVLITEQAGTREGLQVLEDLLASWTWD